MTLRALTVLCALWPGASLAQVQDTVWEDPSLRAAIADADVIVRGTVSAVGADGAVFQVAATFKGRERKGEPVHVAGLHHPQLAERPPVEVGDEAYLLLRGDPQGEVFLVPTPSFGRFPLRAFGEQRLVVASLGDTFVRLPVEPAWFEHFLRAALGGDASPLLRGARASLGGEDLDSTSAYVALSVLAEFGATRDEASLLAVLADARFTRDETWKVRVVASRALGRVGTRGAAQRLLELVEGDTIGAVRSAAATGLGQILLAQASQRWTLPLAERLAAVALAELTPQRLAAGSAEPIRFARLDDPRTNTMDPLLAAILRALGRARSRAGVASALRAIERHQKPSGVGIDTQRALVAGLAYLEALSDPALAGEVALRMRAEGAEDELFNPLFVRTLRSISGEDAGETREDWLRWWKRVAPPQGPQPEGPR
jgi:hypothetical protein